MIDELLLDRAGVQVYRRQMQHGRDVGTSRHIEVRVGSLRLFVERAVGVYGFRGTVSYAVRWWMEA